MGKERIVLKSEQQKQLEQDKDLIVAELMLQNAELQQQINDVSMIIADIMGGNK